MDQELRKIVDILTKPLHLEAKMGWQDKAVAGGLEAYIKAWAEKGRFFYPQFGNLEGIFSNYGRLSTAQRQARVQEALAFLEKAKAGEPKPKAKSLTLANQPKAQAKEELKVAERQRPASGLYDLSSPVRVLPGVGAQRSSALGKLGVQNIEDLLHYYPRAWQDRSHFLPIAQLRVGENATVSGSIRGASTFRTRSRLVITEVAVQDDSGLVFALYFNQPYQQKRFVAGERVVLSGRVERKGSQLQMMNPEAELLPRGEEELIHTGRIVPIYPLNKELSQRPVRSAVWHTLPLTKRLDDYLPEGLRRNLGFEDLPQALSQIHFPENNLSLEKAKRRLIFDELFLISLGLSLRKEKKALEEGIGLKSGGRLAQGLLKGLPFQLTRAQERVWSEIEHDLAKPHPMHRLVQGDVGCGKTLLAALALACACDNGFQGALMAPTEILAEQHLQTLKTYFEPLGLEVVRLLQGQKGAERKEVLDHLNSGQPMIVVGTHALIQEGVEFGRLGLAVVDEQHRFGVMQRLKLSKKAKQKPHVLVMTATPIPRTLAMTVYGDLDVSIVDELPPGRKGIKTSWLLPKQRSQAYDAIRSQVRSGRQAYIVYALVEESEKSERKAATQMAEHLKKEVFPEFKVGLLHGRMESDEKEAVMEAFKKGTIQILASTTVIEVGVDVANASLMVVEDAEHFGLAQLHQLRGRVGRGSAESFCFLIGDPKTEEGRQRLEVMVASQDGFKIAEEDLLLRGPGEFLGLRQSGVPDLKLADLIRDQRLLEEAKRQAEKLVQADPFLTKAEHAGLLKAVLRRFEGKLELGEVG